MANEHECECLPGGVTQERKDAVLRAFAERDGFALMCGSRSTLRSVGLHDLHQVCHVALQLQDEGLLGGVNDAPGYGPRDVYVTGPGQGRYLELAHKEMMACE